ncbi:hypothetical protein N7481_008708 [Penicillium waksmanii]|uniref:uncharacterized protein n=1 Tax=Penicillium waksmanii TaxID=69791 RepID=UPI00254671F1|nr:uncharacterized protein N7481_008708 [Penicillium waksmanii]KAJ5975001.1 hypothetical protein N7481_008708 [Penicillium waksmanii]
MSTRQKPEGDREASDVDETPFKCPFNGCKASYRRKEHLQRHRAKHSQHEPFRCPNCERQFGRSDTLRRHLRQHHKINEPTNRARKACEACQVAKSRCEGGPPCEECVRRETECTFKEEGPILRKDHRQPLKSQQSTAIANDPQSPSILEKRDRCIELYFEKFNPYWPFIHRASFYAPREVPLMVQSMIVIGLWASDERASQSAAKDLHNKLDAAIREQTEKWDASDYEVSSSCRWPLATFQAILLHIIFSCMIESRDNSDFELKASLTPKTTELFTALVRSSRKLGLFYYPNILAQYRDTGDEGLALLFIEETKRFNLSLYKLGRKLRLTSVGPHTLDWRVNTDELQFPMPKGRIWVAATRSEWDRAVPVGSIGPELNETVENTWMSRSAELLEYL